MAKPSEEIKKAAELLSRAQRAVAFCGAGVSQESGIATFRDPGGLWDRLSLDEVGTAEGLVQTLMQAPERILPIFLELLDSLLNAAPNPGHLALAELERRHILKTVITQNIDNLHQEAGSTDVVELHGNFCILRCLSCGKKERHERRPFLEEIKKRLVALQEFSLPETLAGIPHCRYCGQIMRPDVVMFGEAVQDLGRAYAAAKNCDIMLVLGASGVVYPAALLPMEAKQTGARIIVINPTENAFRDICDVYLPQKTGVALPAILKNLTR